MKNIFVAIAALLFASPVFAGAEVWEVAHPVSAYVNHIRVSDFLSGIHSETVSHVRIVLGEDPRGTVTLQNAGNVVLQETLSPNYRFVELHPAQVNTAWLMDVANLEIGFSQSLFVKSISLVFLQEGASFPPAPPVPVQPPQPESGVVKLTLQHHELSGPLSTWTYQDLLRTYPGYRVERVVAHVQPETGIYGYIKLMVNGWSYRQQYVHTRQMVTLFDQQFDGPLWAAGNASVQVQAQYVFLDKLEVYLRLR